MNSLLRCVAEAVPLMLAQAAGGFAKSNGPNVLALSGEPAADLNMLFLGRESARFLSDGVTLAARREVPLITLLAPEAKMLAPVARALGLKGGDDVPFMILPRPVEPSGACDIARVDARSAARAARLQASAFALPEASMLRQLNASLACPTPPEVYIASRGGVPMGALTVTRHGDSAGLWTMSTPPEHQRKGLGRALLTRVISDCGKAGVRRFYLLAAEGGRPLYASLGFEVAGMCQAWMSGPSTQIRSSAR
jgi:GNAT superfamily N-acetyltransferase